MAGFVPRSLSLPGTHTVMGKVVLAADCSAGLPFEGWKLPLLEGLHFLGWILLSPHLLK